MNARFPVSVLGFAVLLASSAVQAQRVVVLELRNDKSGKLRTQIERAIRKSGSVEVVSLRQYKAAAAKRKLKSAAAMTPRAVAQLSKVLRLSAAVGGSAGKSLRAQIWDSSGAELSAMRFSLQRGALSQPDARRLADSIALTVGGKKAVRPVPPPTAAAPTAADAVVAAAAAAAAAPPPPPPPPPPPEQKEEPAAMPPKAETAATTPESAVARENRSREEMAEAHTSSEPSGPVAVEAKGQRVGPKLITAQITGTTTWRSYCSRPGFTSCAQYNAVDPGQRPPGDTVDFKAQVPYVGFSLAVDLFPLAESSSLFQGLGLLVGYERGFSLTNVKVQTSAGSPPDRQVYAADQAITALAAFRYFFAFGHRDPLLGYAGVHGGFGTRRFDVDSNAAAPLPGSHRNYPVVGLDVSIPVWKFLRFEGAGNYFLSPKPSSSEISGYGSSASATGWGGDLGLSGDVWGPLGYVVRFRYSRYKDHFSGAGTTWQNGGAAEESYVGVYWGATARF